MVRPSAVVARRGTEWPTIATDRHAHNGGRHLRARVRQAAFTRAPLWLTRGGVARSRSVQRVLLTQRELSMPALPAALDGLRITHLSDLHIGPILGTHDLPWIVEAVNHMHSDLIALTGDFVDLSLSVLDPVIAALKNLQAPLGVWLVPGNHDYLEDGPQLVRRFRAAGLNLLVNQSARLEHNGSPLLIAGVDFAHRSAHLARHVHRTFIGARAHAEVGFRLLLTHHPHAFDHARRHDVHLTLAGHTHGGQLVLGPSRGRRGLIGLGSLGFRYPRGLYQRGRHYLYVTSGVGSWFPLRVRCPAEIACLTLRRTTPDGARDA